MIDMVFVLDSSTSINSTEYETYKFALANGVDHISNLGLDFNLGVIQFATTSQIEFNLDNSMTNDQIVDYLLSNIFIEIEFHGE